MRVTDQVIIFKSKKMPKRSLKSADLNVLKGVAGNSGLLGLFRFHNKLNQCLDSLT